MALQLATIVCTDDTTHVRLLYTLLVIMKPLGLVEVSRTGVLSIKRGAQAD